MESSLGSPPVFNRGESRAGPCFLFASKSARNPYQQNFLDIMRIDILVNRHIRAALRIGSVILMACAMLPNVHGQHASIRLTAKDVFDTTKKVIYREDFRSDFRKWTLSIDAQYDYDKRPLISNRVTKDAVPGLEGRLAAKFTLPGTPGAFRSELAIPAEEGLQERWYGARIAVDQIADASGYIVLQWHAVMGKEKVDRNFPNLAIHQKRDKWVIARAWGSPAKIQRATTELPGNVEPNKLTNWVIHAKWSTDQSGIVEIWKDGDLVYTQKGPNAYSLSIDRTPYLKTGIYRPSRKSSTTAENPIFVRVSDVRIGRADAGYAEVSPVITATLDKWNRSVRTAMLRIPAAFDSDGQDGQVGFVIPNQSGVTGGPTTLIGRPIVNLNPIFSVEMKNIFYGGSRKVNIRGFRHSDCDSRRIPIFERMNAMVNCENGKKSYLSIVYDQSDNNDLPPGLYQGTLFVEARGWKDTEFRRTIEINFNIFVKNMSSQLTDKGWSRSIDFSRRVRLGSVGFVVPIQSGVDGPKARVWDYSREDTFIRVTVEEKKTGARYPVRVRARRDAGTCGKLRMNSSATCYSAKETSILELQYLPSDNPDLPKGQYSGSFLVRAEGATDYRYVEPIGYGIQVSK